MVKDKKIKNYLKNLDIKFDENKMDYYSKAFLRSSFTNETPEDDESNERLEFLGDSILGFIVSDYLFRNHKNFNQGRMTQMKHHVVNKDFLSKIGRELKFEEILSLSKGEDRENLSDKIYEDTFEAFVAAIYLDSNYDEVKKFIDKHITSKIKNIDIQELKDPKTRLQELVQTENRNLLKYETSDHINKLTGKFESKVKFDGVYIGVGEGKSKQDAEKDAAKKALKNEAIEQLKKNIITN
ncbi:MAG: ribonuclease 3 [Candidatus Tyloplasma litorale]|nr:MAG: ribonuclease 3 [Mycoplasmatales bacterium]